MTVNNGGNPSMHFGRQVRKERLARGWSIYELARRTGLTASMISRLENGNRNPTKRAAGRIDAAFPERKGWFSDYQADSQAWTPPGYRHWAEYEDRAVILRTWVGGVIHGLAQTSEYTRAHLLTVSGVTSEVVATRLQGRLERQKRLYERGIPVVHLVDLLSLYRDMGGAEVMAGQCEHLVELGRNPDVQVLVVPARGHVIVHAGVTVTDSAAYTESAAGGSVHTDDDVAIRLRRHVDILQSESYRASESATIIERVGSVWARGESPLTAVPKGETA